MIDIVAIYITCRVFQVKAVWPKTTDPYMRIIVQGYTSKNFQYRPLSNNKDNIVENVLLKMGQNVSKLHTYALYVHIHPRLTRVQDGKNAKT